MRDASIKILDLMETILKLRISFINDYKIFLAENVFHKLPQLNQLEVEESLEVILFIE